MHYEKHLFLNLQSSDYYLFINYIIYLKYIHLKKNILRFKWNIKLWFDENVPHNDDDPSGNMNRPEFSGEKNQRNSERDETGPRTRYKSSSLHDNTRKWVSVFGRKYGYN